MQKEDEKETGKTEGCQDKRVATTELKYSWDEKYFLIYIGGHKEQNCQCGYGDQTQEALLECTEKEQRDENTEIQWQI